MENVPHAQKALPLTPTRQHVLHQKRTYENWTNQKVNEFLFMYLKQYINLFRYIETIKP